MADTFDPIHALLRRQEYGDAIDRVYDEEGNGIRSPFDEDANHAWYVVGDARFKLGDIGGAMDAFRHALAEVPDDADAMWAIADCHRENRETKQAETMLRQALLCQPDNQAIQYDLGNALFDQGKFEEAKGFYGDAIEGDDEEIARRARTNFGLAEEGHLRRKP